MPLQIPGLENLSPAVKYVIAFAIIFALLALFALVLRRLTGGRSSLASERGRSRQPRLGIVDVYDLDRQRQLILLRRDNVEHLLLVGGPNDVVVETNIVRVAGARLPTMVTDNLDRESAAEVSAARPIVDGALARPGDGLVAARLGSSESVTAGPNGSGSASVGREPMLKPTIVSAGQSAERPVRPAPPPAPSAERGSTPEGVRPLELKRQPTVTEPARAASPRPEPLPRAEAPPRPEPVQRPEPPRRPEPPPRPEPPLRVEPPPRSAPMPAAEMRVRAPEPPPRPAEPPRPTRPLTPPPPSAELREPAPAVPVRPPAPPAPAAAPPVPGPLPEKAPPAAVPATKTDPFSIEDIEAEFARLLGRPLDKKD